MYGYRERTVFGAAERAARPGETYVMSVTDAVAWWGRWYPVAVVGLLVAAAYLVGNVMYGALVVLASYFLLFPRRGLVLTSERVMLVGAFGPLPPRVLRTIERNSVTQVRWKRKNALDWSRLRIASAADRLRVDVRPACRAAAERLIEAVGPYADAFGSSATPPTA